LADIVAKVTEQMLWILAEQMDWMDRQDEAPRPKEDTP
jgi:hypothetical protein